MLRIRLFGSIAVEVNGEPLPPVRSRRGLYLLALLALRANRDVARLWLAGTLWPESDDLQGLENLRRSLTDLRKALGPAAELLQSPTKHTLQLRLAPEQLDVLGFDEAVREDTTAALERALALYTAPLLEDCYEVWVRPEQELRQETYLATVERLASRKQVTGELAGLIPTLREAVARDPLREGLCRLLMTALTETGNPSAATEVYRELRSSLLKQHNVNPSAELTALYNRIRAAATVAVSAPAPPSVVHKQATPYALPRPLTALIGRERELEAILQCLGNAPLVTLTGTGGIGKTRLALETAWTQQKNQPDGACFVDLAPVADPALLPRAAAAALGLQETDEQPLLEALIDHLRPRTLLLVLDNCEHLIDASAELAGRLLRDCPNLQILATSRQPLGITGEVVWRVPVLEVPPREGAPEELVERYAALRLFFERARAVQSTLALTQSSVDAAIEICRHLDGIALAIELAAARVKSLSVEQIALRLEDRFRLLTGGSRNALPRQQTLRALVDWSYELLPPKEQLLLARLSVFGDSYSLEATEAICGDGVELDSGEILDLLEQLVDKSLVLTEESEEGLSRYRMLETIREYSRLKLPEGDLATLGERYRSWYLALAQQSEANLLGSDQAHWLTVLDGEHHNLRKAIALSTGESHLELCAALCRYWYLRGHWSEGREQLDEALGRADAARGSAARAKALMGAGNLARSQSDYPVAIVHYEACLVLYRELGDAVGHASTLNNLATVLMEEGDYVRAQALYEESLTLSRELDDKGGISRALHNLGMIANEQGDNERALAFYSESLALSRALGNRYLEANGLNNLGNVAVDQGDYKRARALIEQALLIDRELGMDAGIASSLNDLGRIELALGSYESAQRLVAEGLELYRRLGDQRGIALSLHNQGLVLLAWGRYDEARQRLTESLQLGHLRCLADTLVGLAHLALREEQLARAARLYGAADQVNLQRKGILAFLERRIHDDDLEQLTETLGPELFEKAYATGHALTTEAALQLAAT